VELDQTQQLRFRYFLFLCFTSEDLCLRRAFCNPEVVQESEKVVLGDGPSDRDCENECISGLIIN
jgi:hypothetical protein